MTRQNDQTPHAQTTTQDTSGNAVNVVERDLADGHGDTQGIDKVITPTSVREKEQDAQTLNEKTAEVERKLTQD